MFRRIFHKEGEEKVEGGMSKRIEGCGSIRQFLDRGGESHERTRGAGIASGRGRHAEPRRESEAVPAGRRDAGEHRVRSSGALQEGRSLGTDR